MRPNQKRGRDVWDRVNMPESEFRTRVRKIQKEMAGAGVDILFLYGNGEYYGNPSYIANTETRLVMGGSLVAVPQKGEVTLFHGGGSRELPAAKTTTWVNQIRTVSDYSKDCVAFLKDNNLFPSTVGLAGFAQYMGYQPLKGFLDSIKDCKTVDFYDVMKNIRLIKSSKEREQMLRASRIIILILKEITSNPLQEMNERYLEAVMDRVARLEGAEDCRILIGRPQEKGWVLRPADESGISSGNTLIVYLAVQFERYWSEAIRTLKLEPPGLVLPKMEQALALYEQIVKGLTPGKTVSQFYEETVSLLRNNIVDYISDYGWGQGIGLELQEFLQISEKENTLYREGMCSTFHIALNDKEMGDIMLGDTFYLTVDGAEKLTK